MKDESYKQMIEGESSFCYNDYESEIEVAVKADPNFDINKGIIVKQVVTSTFPDFIISETDCKSIVDISNKILTKENEK